MPANTKAIFQEMFANFQDYYVLIGGTATSIVLDSQGLKVGQQKIMIWSS